MDRRQVRIGEGQDGVSFTLAGTEHLAGRVDCPILFPDDPLLSARRELLGAAAFGQIDLPRASMLLAQASGRLIRTATDRGVVAVLDPRLSTARYGWEIVRALPPMRRTRHRAEAEAFLREITGTPPGG